MPQFRCPPLALSSGAQEVLKWLAVACMTADHVNRFLLQGNEQWMFLVGRQAMPIFTLTLAYNLAQAQALASGVNFRVMKRLLLAGLAASPAYIGLVHPMDGWWPLNVLFSLLAGTAIITLLDSALRGRAVFAVVLFLIAGSCIEAFWSSLILMLACWSYVRTPRLISLTAILLGLIFYSNLTDSKWCFASLVLVMLAHTIRVSIPRLRHVFYIYYPLHLSAIWLIVN